MSPQGGNAPSWLFSFVDLAFLLLIAMTQVGGDGSPGAPDLGEIIVPRLHSAATGDLPSESRELWQLRVHPPEPGIAPFELVSATDAALGAELRLDAATLRDELAQLRGGGAHKPLLAPHEDSRSQDMLDAVGMVEEFWPSRRRVTVSPLLAQH